jgi:hypothetical protein
MSISERKLKPEPVRRIEVFTGAGGRRARIGEDTAERLDIVPAQFRVLVVRRPKSGCRSCQDVVVQASAPPRLIEGGLPRRPSPRCWSRNIRTISLSTGRRRSTPGRA